MCVLKSGMELREIVDRAVLAPSGRRVAVGEDGGAVFPKAWEVNGSYFIRMKIQKSIKSDFFLSSAM